MVKIFFGIHRMIRLSLDFCKVLVGEVLALPVAEVTQE